MGKSEFAAAVALLLAVMVKKELKYMDASLTAGRQLRLQQALKQTVF